MAAEEYLQLYKNIYSIKKIVLVMPIFFIMSCVQSDLMKEVDNPRSGNPIKSRLAIVYSSNYQISLAGMEKLHPFDINKYSKIFTKLVEDSLLKPEDVYVPDQVSEDAILQIHTREFLSSLKSSGTIATYLEAAQLKLLPSKFLDGGVLEPFRFACGGTLLAAQKALEFGIAVNIGGGFHHAKPDMGEGFCIYADIPITIRSLQSEGKIKKVMVIDLDVHQGNGTAVCLANDSSTFTFSMHQGDIYPFPKEKSDLDIELNSGIDDEAYLEILTKNLPNIFEQSKPDIVFLVGGCDTIKDDPLASLSMTEEGIVKRDWRVIDECVKRKVPVVMTLAGGYSKNAWHVQYSSIRNIIESINE